MTGQNLGIIS